MNFHIMTHTCKTRRLPNMKYILILSMALLTIFGQGAVGAATAKPLEHSPGELAWADWIQQGSGQSEAQPPPRRITTKSLFIFPNIVCPDNYRVDSLGRCVKIVKLDENAHMGFLLEKLNSQYGIDTSENQEDLYDYDVDTEAPDTSGPFQFNIPIAMQVQAPKPEDSEGSGDEIILFKKEAPSAMGIPTTLPTSAPEYIPGDMDFKIPADEPSSSMNKNDTSDSPPTVADSGTTIVLSNNGKFENLTSSNVKEINDLDIVKEHEDISNSTKIDEIKHDLKQILTEAVDSAASSILKTILEEIHVNYTSSYENKSNTSHDASKTLEKIALKSDETTKNTANDKKVTSPDQLVEQIESLKNGSLTNTNNSSNDASSITRIDLNGNDKNLFETGNNQEDKIVKKSEENLKIDDSPPEIDFDYEKGLKLRPSDSMDIEEKIKVISRYADVTRNTDENPHVNYEQKKTPSNPEIFPNLPHPYNRFNYYNPIDTVISPSNNIRFPTETKPIPNNYISSQEQLLPYEKIRPFNVQKNDHLNGNYRHKAPYWLPQNWNIEQPKDDQAMNFWSRMPLIPEYPFVTNVEHNRHPMHYQSIYPNSHQANGRINLRHTSVNHRRGRLNNRDRQTEHEEAIIYARGRHPHYRE